MTLTSTNISLVTQRQKKENGDFFKENRFLLFYSLLCSKKIAPVKQILKDLDFSVQEIDLYKSTLLEEGLVSKSDISYLKKITIAKTGNDDLKEKVSEVVRHLNKVTGRSFKEGKETTALISKWLSADQYSVEDFKRVNFYFYLQWGSSYDMKKYVRPVTLYNGKFPDRVIEASDFFDEINKYKEEIEKICKKLPAMVSAEIRTEQNITEKGQQKEDEATCKNIPFSIRRKLSHWLSKNYTVDTIVDTVIVTADQWSRKPSLLPHITLSKILDEKFPDRVNAVRKLIAKNNDFANPNVHEVAKWMRGEQ